MIATPKPTTIDEARVRVLAFNASVLADQGLGIRARLQEISDELYPLLQFADPKTDRSLEVCLVHLCRALNELYGLHALQAHAKLLQHFRKPPEPVQVPDLVGPFTAQSEVPAGVGKSDPRSTPDAPRASEVPSLEGSGPAVIPFFYSPLDSDVPSLEGCPKGGVGSSSATVALNGADKGGVP